MGWRRRTFGALACLAFVSAAACGLSVVGSGSSVENGGAADANAPSSADGAVPPGPEHVGDAGADSAHDADAEAPIARDDAGCPTGRGPSMMKLFSPALCIDETEVSSRQYMPFISDFDAGLAPAQIAECAGNASVVPVDMTTGVTPPLASDDPVDRIDWCDAQLYCAWAGKHLCARRDGTSAFIDATDADNASIGEWYAACSQDGASSSVPALANLQSNSIAGRDADGQVLVTAPPPGGPTYAGRVLRHIVGNVEEWADGCDGSGNCIARGASEKTTGQTDCTTRTIHARMDRRADLGFRCCAKPIP
jgi:formylglycine-generating enzyme required for sulfatase activity